MPQDGAPGGRIEVTRGGPYVVSGSVPLIGSSRRIPTNEIYSLCRCGRSSRKPFCDGTHAKVGFDGRGSGAGPGLDPPDGPGPDIEARDDGPLAVRDVAVRLEDGSVAPCTHATLCRCGASATKPFCDGSHLTSGFPA